MKKNLESGRSMVEMLGVLAIIGVLSVGGIGGYKTAMDRHGANQILSYLNSAMITLDGAIRISGNKNTNEAMTIDLDGENIVYDRQNKTVTFAKKFQFNKDTCKILARDLTVKTYNYLSDSNLSGRNLYIVGTEGSGGGWLTVGSFGSNATDTAESARLAQCNSFAGDEVQIQIKQ